MLHPEWMHVPDSQLRCRFGTDSSSIRGMADNDVARISAGRTTFDIHRDGGAATVSAGDLRTSSRRRFWTMSLALGQRRDIAVHSEDQRGDVVESADGITVRYTRVTTVDGDTLPVDFTVSIGSEGNALTFAASGTVGAEARVQEMALPVLELDESTERHDEVLYRAEGLGRRITSPREKLGRAHTEYMVDDGAGIWESAAYPGELSMPWQGLETGDSFLYFGRHDPGFRSVMLSSGVPPRKGPRELWLAAVTPCGRSEFEVGPVVVALLDGSWKAGAAYYRSWADEWYTGPSTGLLGMQGWQRIIMRHQFGAVQFRYADLVDVYEEGRRHGLDGILLFGWWKGGFDRGYPTYEPDDELGGADELSAAIREIRDRGGFLSLYANGNLIDRTTEYFTEYGHELTKKDWRGLDNVVGYDFAAESQSLRHFSAQSFVVACHGAPRWRHRMAEVAATHVGLGADSVFFDQTAYHLAAWPCFDETHEHGSTTGQEAPYRRKTLEGVRRASNGSTVGSEGMADCMISALDFHHGWGFAFHDEPEAFPAMFRTVFPEPVVTNRLVHDEKTGWRDQLNYAFFYNLAFDVSIHRGRRTISAYPDYAEQVGLLTGLRRQHLEHFVHGRFELVSASPAAHARYVPDSGPVLDVYWNSTDETIEFDGVRVDAHGVAAVVGDAR